MQALLPPPFPTASPVRCYVSNMAVLPGFRRRGAATALLQSCARLGTPAEPLLACCLHTKPTWPLHVYLLATACCRVRHIACERGCTLAVLLFLGRPAPHDSAARERAAPAAGKAELVTCGPADAALGAAALWGQDSLWLHVDADNEAALCLYAAAGFALHMEDGGWFGLPRRRLLRRQLRRRGPAAAGGSPSPRSDGQSSGDVGPAPEDRLNGSRPGNQDIGVSRQGERGHVSRLDEMDGAQDLRGSGTYLWQLGKQVHRL